MTLEKILVIPSAEVTLIQGWLDSKEQVPDAKDTETIKTYTVVFNGDIEVDIKVCNGDTGPYIDAVIFDAGCEIGFLDVRDTLLGVYDFIEDDDCCRVIVKQGD